MSRPRLPLIRPKPETIEVEISTLDGTTLIRRGYDLDSILRAVVVDIIENGELSLVDAAGVMGLPVTTLREWVRGATTLRTTSLSKLCAALQISPVRLFELHEVYKPENLIGVRFADESIYEGVRRVLTPDQAKRVVALAARAAESGGVDLVLDAIETLIPERRRKSPKRRKKRDPA